MFYSLSWSCFRSTTWDREFRSRMTLCLNLSKCIVVWMGLIICSLRYQSGRPWSMSLYFWWLCPFPCHKLSQIFPIRGESSSDVDMYFMIEKELARGKSLISHRKLEADNKYMKSYVHEKESNTSRISMLTRCTCGPWYSICHMVVWNGLIQKCLF